jgi:hypothetical protein
MNDGGCGERVAGLRLTGYDRPIGNQGYDDELQSDQGTPDDPTIT